MQPGHVQMWRVYQRGLERWLANLLQPVFDNLVAEVAVPRFVQRLRILEFTLDHEAPTFSRMRRRSSRKDSDLNGVVDVRYTGGARMLLLIEVGQGKWRFKASFLPYPSARPLRECLMPQCSAQRTTWQCAAQGSGVITGCCPWLVKACQVLGVCTEEGVVPPAAASAGQ